ncbi:unnamed protein product [Clonostachys rhizophaga]|uniref:Aldehyde dehydrogenase domain-containing protein n=1 Tax=Clonostachys rhizophaga TaxID=160324 RepID=A0A9N9YRM9_9HYPO|nr:unnamed protein product [Clonostachys rhizophaga]
MNRSILQQVRITQQPERWFNIRHRRLSTKTTVPLVINGKDVETSNVHSVISPLTGKPIWSLACTSSQHLEDAIQSAHSAFPRWSKTKAFVRSDIFLTAADIMNKRRSELGEYMHHEIGANQRYQDFILGLAIDGLKDTAGRIFGAVQGSTPESTYEGIKVIVHKRPYRVNLRITSNAPYHLGLRSISFALAPGNTAILKGAELSLQYYWGIINIFREASLPDGALNLIFHSPQDTGTTISALVSHPTVKKINFTGSTRVSSIISEIAGKHLKPVLIELGGKASAIVLEDADLEQAALHCARGAFINAGQIYISTEHVLVQDSIAPEFQNILQRTIQDLFGPYNCGFSLTKPGLNIRYSRQGCRISTNLQQHSQRSNLYTSESFGPSVSLFTFETLNNTITLANDTDYGLSASIFTDDLGKAFRIADELESGAVHINSMTVHDKYPLPHGGVTNSGFGCFNGYQGLDEFLYYKTVTWME